MGQPTSETSRYVFECRRTAALHYVACGTTNLGERRQTAGPRGGAEGGSRHYPVSRVNADGRPQSTAFRAALQTSTSVVSPPDRAEAPKAAAGTTPSPGCMPTAALHCVACGTTNLGERRQTAGPRGGAEGGSRHYPVSLGACGWTAALHYVACGTTNLREPRQTARPPGGAEGGSRHQPVSRVNADGRPHSTTLRAALRTSASVVRPPGLAEAPKAALHYVACGTTNLGAADGRPHGRTARTTTGPDGS